LTALSPYHFVYLSGGVKASTRAEVRKSVNSDVDAFLFVFIFPSVPAP